MTAKRWLGTLARHYPSLLVSGVCHKALGEIERLEDASCTGCINAPAKDGEPYEEECVGCRRFYADCYETEENTK